MADNLAEQLQLQLQINDAIQQRAKLLKDQAQLLSQQAGVSQKMCKSMQSCGPSKDSVRRTEELKEGLEEGSEKAEEMSENLNEMAECFQRMAEEQANASEGGSLLSSTFGKVLSAGLGLFSISSIFNKIGGIVQTVTGIVTGLVQGIFSVGKAILFLPLDILGGIISMAGSMGGGGGELRKAYEEVREEFGRFDQEARHIIGAMKNIKKQQDSVGGSGVRMRKIFGYGQKGMAEAMKWAAEMGKAMGHSLRSLGPILEENAGELAAMQKALGLTAEEMTAMMKTADYAGKDVMRVMADMAELSKDLAVAVDVAEKRMGKALGEAAKDFEHFGDVSKPAMAASIAKVVQMGIEVKALAGIMDKWLNFEDAAESASALNAALGVQIDTYKMVTAASPGEQLEELRRAFKASGKDLDSMTHAQKALIKQQMGWDDATMRAMMSAKKEGKSQQDLQDEADKTLNKKRELNEIMEEMGKNIKRLVETGNRQFKSFWDAFAQGFSRGVKRSHQFRSMLRAIRKSLNRTYQFGRKIGKMFITSFPGIAKMVGGLKKIFDPSRFQKTLLDPLKKAFKEFFDAVGGSGGKFSVKVFLEKVRKIFTGWLGGGAGGGGDIWKGFQQFAKAFKNIFIGLVQYAAEGLTKGIKWLTAFIQSPSVGPFGEMWDALVEMFSAVWLELKTSLGPSFTELGSSIADLWSIAWPMLMDAYEEYRPMIQEFGKQLWDDIFNWEYIDYVLYGLGAVLVAALAPIIVGLLPILGAVLAPLGALFRWIFSAVPPAPPGNPFAGLGGILNMAGQLALIGAFLYGLVNWIVIPAMEAIDEMENVTADQVIAFGLLVVELIGAAVLAMGAAFIASKMDPTSATKGLVAVGLFALAMGALGAALVFLLSKAGTPKELTAVGKFFTGFADFLEVVAWLIPIAMGVATVIAASWGIGAGVLAIGMVAVGGFAALLVLEVVPVLKILAEISNDVKNPAALDAIMKNLGTMLQSMADFAGNIGRVLEAINPGLLGTLRGETMSGNIAAVSKMLDSMLKNGLVKVIDLIIELAKSSSVTRESAQAATAIGTVLTALASIMGALQPNSANIEAIMKEIDDDDIPEMLTAMTDFVTAQGSNIVTVIQESKQFIIDIIDSLKGVKFDAATAQVVSSMASLLTAIAAIMKAFSPTDGEMNAVATAADNVGESGIAMMNAVNARLPMIKDAITGEDGILAHLGGVMEGLGDSLGTFVNAAATSGASPAMMNAASKMMGIAVKAMTTLLKTVGGVTKSFAKITEGSEGADWENLKSLMEAFTPMLTGAATAMKDMFPVMSGMVSDIVAATNKMKDPKLAMDKLNVFLGAMEMIKIVGSLFSAKGPFSGVQMDVGPGLQSPLQNMASSIGTFVDLILHGDKPLERLFSGVASINVTDRDVKRLKRLKRVFGYLDPVMTSIKGMKDLPGTMQVDVIVMGLKAMAGLFAGGSQGELSKFLNGVASISKHLHGKTSRRLKNLKKIFGYMDPIMDSMGDLKDVMGKTKTGDLLNMRANMDWISAHILGENGSMAKLFDSVAFLQVPEGLTTNMQLASMALEEFEQMWKRIVTLDEYMGTEGIGAIDQFNATLQGNALTAAGEVAATLAELDGLFDKIQTQGIEVAFSDFAGAMASGAKQHMVSIGDHRLNVNIDVHIKLGRKEMVEYLSGNSGVNSKSRLALKGTGTV
ncbi:MAG: hypothetical protein CMB80_09360 [Flammeovirgaceae bacterium]|nr:hypothetical protein [Flammeovirgaceae bacterium]